MAKGAFGSRGADKKKVKKTSSPKEAVAEASTTSEKASTTTEKPQKSKKAFALASEARRASKKGKAAAQAKRRESKLKAEDATDPATAEAAREPESSPVETAKKKRLRPGKGERKKLLKLKPRKEDPAKQSLDKRAAEVREKLKKMNELAPEEQEELRAERREVQRELRRMNPALATKGRRERRFDVVKRQREADHLKEQARRAALPKNKAKKSAAVAAEASTGSRLMEEVLAREAKPKKKARITEGEGAEESSGPEDSDLESDPGADGGLKVFVGNLGWKVDKKTVEEDFAACGELESFDMPNARSGQSAGRAMGIAFVVYKTKEGVAKALEYDQTEYGGRTINVKLSKPPPKSKVWGPGSGETAWFEARREKKGLGRGYGACKGKGKGKGKSIDNDSENGDGKGKGKGQGRGKGAKGKGDGTGKGAGRGSGAARQADPVDV